jgi:ATP-dependent HslUV protease ATP-binding subunit HslU
MNHSPEQIFAELDRHVIGQTQAKRAVAIALRNRWRRLQLTPEEQASIHPHHILMIGPSGVGKTEVARRLAILSDSPFIKVEATQYTEVGYVGKDITSIVEEVVGAAQALLQSQSSRRAAEQRKAQKKSDKEPVVNAANASEATNYTEQISKKNNEAVEKIIDLIELTSTLKEIEDGARNNNLDKYEPKDWDEVTRKSIHINIMSGGPEFDMMKVYVPTFYSNPFDKRFERAMEIFEVSAMQVLAPLVMLSDEDDDEEFDFTETYANVLAGAKAFKKNKLVSVGKLKELWFKEANREVVKSTMRDKTKDNVIEQVMRDFGFDPASFDSTRTASYKSNSRDDAVMYAENYGIIFIDEFDKLAGVASDRGQVSRQGVQRDLLPLLDGCTVQTKQYGPVDTTNMLFICSGAFQLNKPEELLVEIQGRLPIRVQMEALSVDDFVKILRIKEDNILDQYRKLMSADGIDLVFEDQAVKTIAEIAFQLNMNHGNYGARRLYGCVEKVLEDVTYLSSPGTRITMTITEEYVKNHISSH